MPKREYDAQPGVLVLSADLVPGLVAPGALVNHVTYTKIYGDGRVVFIDPAIGSGEIHEGQLDGKAIAKLFATLRANEFWSFSETYFKAGPTDLPTNMITAARRGEPEKRVSCYGGVLSAPPGFMACYQELLYPQIQPSNVMSYERRPISEQELAEGHYYGFEYQKKLNTPRDWVWVEAGRSSSWRRPELHLHSVTLDSGYLTSPVDGCHHISIHYTGDPVTAGSTVQFDRNAMSPNQFGDIGITTLMYFAPRPATFTLLHTEGDKQLFGITMTGYSGPKLRLVLLGDPARPSRGRLLVMNDEEAIKDIHCLQVRMQ